ncbi:MAG: fimbrillin family protein [Bacteroidaceae bacterium]|nr:fimbrillin family protein [Bacteroidaceae bacterium]
MKKTTFIIVATALVISCANNDVKNDIVNEIPIGFETYSSLATKGTSALTLESYHTTFGVWGYKTVSGSESAVMAHYKVIYNDANGSNATYKWNYDGTNAPSGQYLKYWDKAASQYRFDAYAPHSSNASITDHVISIASGQYAANENIQATLNETLNTTKFSGTGSTAANASTDWMTATTTRTAVSPATIATDVVNLSFSHLLTKVIVAVKTKTDFPKDINITSISLNNVFGTASYNGSVWSTAGSTAVNVPGRTGTISDAEKTDGANNHVYYSIECLVIPQASATPTFSVTYTIGNDPEVFTVTAAAITGISAFAAGTVYTITATIGPEPIHFDCALSSDWTPGSAGSVTVE